MANLGFFLGGLAQGYQDQSQITNQAQYQQQLVGLEQQRLQQQQKNQQRSEYMQLRAQAVDHLGQTVSALKNAHPDWTEAQLMTNPAVASQVQQLSGFDKNLGLDPNSAQSIAAGFAAGPSEVQTARMKAEATGTYGKEVAQTAEANARTGYLNRGGLPASFDDRFNGPTANPSNPDLDTNTQLGGKPFVSSGSPQVDNIVKGIQNGDQPPVFTGLGQKFSGPVRAGLEANGVNVAKLQLQWKSAEKDVQSLRGPQMQRYVGLSKSVLSTIDEVNANAKEMKLGGVPALNQLQLQQYVQTEGNSPKGQLAAKYIASVGLLKEEVANLANGGYAPTDPAWKLANDQVNGNYGWQELGSSLGEMQKLLKIRFNQIPGMTTLGPGAPNTYTGGGAPQEDPLGLLK